MCEISKVVRNIESKYNLTFRKLSSYNGLAVGTLHSKLSRGTMTVSELIPIDRGIRELYGDSYVDAHLGESVHRTTKYSSKLLTFREKTDYSLTAMSLRIGYNERYLSTTLHKATPKAKLRALGDVYTLLEMEIPTWVPEVSLEELRARIES